MVTPTGLSPIAGIWLVAIFSEVIPGGHELSTPSLHSSRPPEAAVSSSPESRGHFKDVTQAYALPATVSTPATKTPTLSSSGTSAHPPSSSTSSSSGTSSHLSSSSAATTPAAVPPPSTSTTAPKKRGRSEQTAGKRWATAGSKGEKMPKDAADSYVDPWTRKIPNVLSRDEKPKEARGGGSLHEERVRKLIDALNGSKKKGAWGGQLGPVRVTERPTSDIWGGTMNGPRITGRRDKSKARLIGSGAEMWGGVASKPARMTGRPVKGEEKNGVPGRRRFSMGIPASSTVVLAPVSPASAASTPAPAAPPADASRRPSVAPIDSDEYYSSYGDYPDLSAAAYNASGGGSGGGESAVLPDPEAEVEVEVESDAEADADAEALLPDDSLADTDLHDHDLIDSVMYIYFGSSERDERGAGRQVLVVGAVISLVAQCLTIVSVARRIRPASGSGGRREPASVILLNAEIALTAANLVFMFGVQATGSRSWCFLVAALLHYLHLAAGGWLLVNSAFARAHLRKTGPPPLAPFALAAWTLPALLVAACVAFNRRGYETRAFCWVSVARGMLYTFMAPVALLLLANTWLAVEGLRRARHSMEEKGAVESSPDDDGARRSVRVSATLLPAFAVVWFLGVVALENSASLVFPLLFVACNALLNWFILACWLPSELTPWRETDDDYGDDDDFDDPYEAEEALKRLLEAEGESQPALHYAGCPGGRRPDPPYDLQMDPICTISS